MINQQTRRSFLKKSLTSAGAAIGLGCSPFCSPATAAVKTFRGRFAICNETFGDWPFDKAFGLAAECGYEGIEIAPFTISDYVTDITQNKRKEIRKQAEKEGLEIEGLHWLLARTKGFHLTSPDKEVRQKTVGYLGELARFCADLGTVPK